MKFSIWTGAAWERWTPQSPREGGIGGSETAAVAMAKELAALGHQVEVYGDFQEGRDGKHFGVDFIQYRTVMDPGQISCDVFVSSRDMSAILLRPETKIKAIWVHDINLGHDIYDRLDKYDVVLCLSEWSARTMAAYYPQLRKSKISVVRNGIDIERFKPDIPASKVLEEKSWPPRITYSSSPDRGLDKLLDLWPQILDIQPGCELHVYYGFDNWRKMAGGMPHQLAAIEWLGERLNRMADKGVYYHGRVGQQELADSYMKSMFWLYPTDFKETSCISAMEAQAAGAVPVCTGLAALKETVKHGVFIKPYNREPRYEKDFLQAFEELIQNSEKRKMLAIEGRKHALENLSWRGVAESWIEIFSNKIAEKAGK